jgi:hypothetical protein
MEQFKGWSFSMRKIHKAQPAGEAAYMETKGMDEGEAPKIHTLKVADDPEEGFQDSLPPWLKGNDLFALKAQTPGLLICGPNGGEEGAILRQKRKLVIGGSSKMGKTWTLCDLALAVASGGKWLGKYKCEQGAVLYVNLELDGSTAARRMEWIASFRDLTENDQLAKAVSDNLLTWNLRGKCYDLSIMLSSARQRLKDVPGGLRLIILDPIYKTYGGRDENAAGDMASLMLELEQFADDCGAAIAFAAHFSKGNQAAKSAMDRISGSGVIARDPDAIVTFTDHEDEGCFVMEASLREFAPVPAAVFEWACPVLNPRDDLDATKLRQAGKAAVSMAPERAEAVRLALVANGGELPRKSALVAAIKSGNKFPTDGLIRAWQASIDRQENLLAQTGIEEVQLGQNQMPLWRLKVADRKNSNDPF